MKMADFPKLANSHLAIFVVSFLVSMLSRGKAPSDALAASLANRRHGPALPGTPHALLCAGEFFYLRSLWPRGKLVRLNLRRHAGVVILAPPRERMGVWKLRVWKLPAHRRT